MMLQVNMFCRFSTVRMHKHYHIPNAMQYSNTALETTPLMMYDPNTFFYMVSLFLMALQIP